MQKILLVEDDHDVREMFAEVLRDAGYSVEEAENGRQALEQIEARNEPYLMLVDMMMPEMTGPELLDELERRRQLDSMAVIALSAGGEPRDIPQAEMFLRKPLLPDHLLSAVKEYADPVDPRSWVS